MVGYKTALSVLQNFGPSYLAAKYIANALMTQANPESGDFEVSIRPKGATTDRKTTPYTVESCVHLNDQPAPGSTGWTGNGTISGYVTKDGSIELTTSWTSMGGQIQVTGSWSGAGTVEDPDPFDDP